MSVMPESLESPPVTHRAPIHLRPTAELSERVLLPGDPGRALALSQSLLSEPRMFNHHRGLWGYTGAALADGKPLTIQSTGMGGPSAAIVLVELIALGVRRAIRVGTCGALDGRLALGDMLIAREAICADGTSQSLGAGERASGDRALTEALEHATVQQDATAQQGERQMPRRTHAGATIVSTDLFYDPDPERNARWNNAGAVAVEMEAASLFAVGAHAAVPVACLLTVSNTLGPEDRQELIDDEALLKAAQAMGALATAALAE